MKVKINNRTELNILRSITKNNKLTTDEYPVYLRTNYDDNWFETNDDESSMSLDEFIFDTNLQKMDKTISRLKGLVIVQLVAIIVILICAM